LKVITCSYNINTLIASSGFSLEDIPEPVVGRLEFGISLDEHFKRVSETFTKKADGCNNSNNNLPLQTMMIDYASTHTHTHVSNRTILLVSCSRHEQTVESETKMGNFDRIVRSFTCFNDFFFHYYSPSNISLAV